MRYVSIGAIVFLYALWDFVTIRNENVIHRWVDDERLTKRDRAILNQKFDRLRQVDFQMAIGTKLVAGPLYGLKHIYKMVIHGDVMLRPMLCRGPFDNEAEYTLLQGAIETGDRQPKREAQQAAKNREIILQDKDRRRPHERVP